MRLKEQGAVLTFHYLKKSLGIFFDFIKNKNVFCICNRPQNKLVTSGILGATPVKEKGRYCETDHAHQWSLKPRRHYKIENFVIAGVVQFQGSLQPTVNCGMIFKVNFTKL